MFSGIAALLTLLPGASSAIEGESADPAWGYAIIGFAAFMGGLPTVIALLRPVPPGRTGRLSVVFGVLLIVAMAATWIVWAVS